MTNPPGAPGSPDFAKLVSEAARGFAAGLWLAQQAQSGWAALEREVADTLEALVGEGLPGAGDGTARFETLLALSPADFERWVGQRFEDRGYRVRRTGTHGSGGDHGIDLQLLKRGADGAVLERAVVQCKNWRTWSVGEPVVRDLYGVLTDAGADRAYLVTTGRVTASARAWIGEKPIEVWDGTVLRRLLAAPPKARVTEVRTATPTQPALTAGTHGSSPRTPGSARANGCPQCGAGLVARTNRSTGEPFWGCATFPACRFTRPRPASGAA